MEILIPVVNIVMVFVFYIMVKSVTFLTIYFYKLKLNCLNNMTCNIPQL